MKRFIIMAGTLMMIATACKKTNDRIFDESPNERIEKTLTAYQEQLAGATYGWRAIIEPAGGGAYGFYFKFNDANRVTMFSDFTLESATTEKESSYRLKGLQQPSLLFDTYSYLHVLADPDNRVNGGTRGAGLRSDFEFYFEPSSADTIHLVGRFNGSKATLIKATQEEQAGYEDGGIADSYLFDHIADYVNYFKRVTIDGVEYEIIVNLNTKTIIFNWKAGGAPKTFSTHFYYGASGILFTEPFRPGAQIIPGFTDISFNASTVILGFNVNGAAATVTGTGEPMNVDLDAPRRWWQYSFDQQEYWISLNGFRVNGVEDAFGVNTIPDYYYSMYSAAYGIDGTTPLDASGIFYINSAGTALNLFAPAYYQPTFTADGRVIFDFYGGTFGTNPGGSTISVISDVLTQMTDPLGFYLVQTGELEYDMVNARDGKAWITWVW